MAGKAFAIKTGEELKQKVILLSSNLGLQAETEVKAARRIWGAGCC